MNLWQIIGDAMPAWHSAIGSFGDAEESLSEDLS